jgi:D-beta-D-heptose 7-phosphate kinase/D-beta-D-heptose 1-phosphate adenosyltransferase
MASPKLPDAAAKVIGFTYGTFDLLHDGHIYFLRRARRRCDQLIVAIDSDRLARVRKGPGRPVDDEAQRSHNLIATRLVDLVIAVNDDRHLADALAYYEPDIVFAGDDARGQVLKPFTQGGTVVLFPLLPGHSTTDAIKARLQ